MFGESGSPDYFYLSYTCEMDDGVRCCCHRDRCRGRCRGPCCACCGGCCCGSCRSHCRAGSASSARFVHAVDVIAAASDPDSGSGDAPAMPDSTMFPLHPELDKTLAPRANCCETFGIRHNGENVKTGETTTRPSPSFAWYPPAHLEIAGFSVD